MKTDVVMVTNAIAPDKLGGLERYVRELAAALVRVGVNTSVIAKKVNPEDADSEVGDDGVAVFRHTVPRKTDPMFALKYPHFVRRGVARALQTWPNAIVHGHFPVAMAALGGRKRNTASARYLYTFHAPVYRELLAERQGTYLLPKAVQNAAVKRLRKVEAAVVADATSVAVLSEFMRHELATLSPQAADRALLIPGGIDTARFSRDDAHVPNNQVLFTARRLTPRTGVPTLVTAMADVVASHPQVKLHIAGDGHMRAVIEQQIIDLRLGDNVILLGRISDDDLVAQYRSAASSRSCPPPNWKGSG